MKHKQIDDRLWFALYTRSRAERRVAVRLEEAGFMVYLPLYKRMRVWSDRKKLVEEPLLKGYLFVRVTFKDLFKVLETLGVVKVIGFEGKPVAIPDKQIDVIRVILKSGKEVEVVHETFSPGDRVMIIKGVMKGIEGNLEQLKGKYQLVISVEILNRSIFVTVAANTLKKV